jgi:hypothetical protein
VQVDGCRGAAGCSPVWMDQLQVFAARGASLAAQTVLENSADALLADFNSDGLTDIAYAPNGAN